MSSDYFKSQTTSGKSQSPFLFHLADVVIVLLLVLATIVINLRMIRDGLNGLGDLRWHITWVQHFSKQISEGIWYPRWLAGTNFGYGSPTFVFYPPFIYYLGSVLKCIGLNIEQTISTLFSLALFLSGINFYIYGRTKWGKIPAFCGSCCYMVCPPIIIFINGGTLAALFGLAWIPLGVYLTDKSFTKSRWRVVLAGFWTMVSLTHTPSLLLYGIAWFFYTLSFWFRRSGKAVLMTLISGGIGFGLASFYWLPAILEQRFINIDYMLSSQGGFSKANLLNLGQLLEKGLADLYVQQLFMLVIFALIAVLCSQKRPAVGKEVGIWLGFTLTVFFLISDLSWPIWQSSQTLQKVEGSWRLGGLIYFAQAALCGLATQEVLRWHPRFKLSPSLIIRGLALLVIAGILLLNFKFGYQYTRSAPALHNPGRGKVFIREWLETSLFDPFSERLIDVPEYRPLLQQPNLSAPNRERYTDAGIPKADISNNQGSWLPTPKLGQPRISVLRGRAELEIEQWGSYERRFKIRVQTPAVIRIRTYYYPAWRLSIDNRSHPLEMANDGTLQFELEPGAYLATLRYQWTPAFKLGTVLSLLNLLALVAYGYWTFDKTRGAACSTSTSRREKIV